MADKAFIQEEFLKALAAGFAKIADEPESAWQDYAKNTLESFLAMEGIEYGDADHDWGQSAVDELVSEDVSYWEAE